MTIKEIEERSGMTRANIRFYEAEGLLSPKRGGNGYRDYSEEELDALLRIKLLRTLHISIEEIKQVQKGERELSAVLDSQLERLDQERKELRRSQEICQEMRKDNVSFSTLPVHKAPLTVEKFCDNYNSYLRYYGRDDFRYRLSNEGEWLEEPDEFGTVYTIFGRQPQPKLIFTEKDGAMTGLTMEVTLENGGDDTWVSSRSMERAMLARSFLLAQKGAGIFDNEAHRVVSWIENTPLESFTFSAYGVDVSCEIAYTGYGGDTSGDMLLPTEGERSFQMTFSMRAQG